MIRTQIQLHPEQLNWLKHQALQDNISMSQMIRDCVDFYRFHEEQSQMLNIRKKNALTAVGTFTSLKDPKNK